MVLWKEMHAAMYLAHDRAQKFFTQLEFYIRLTAMLTLIIVATGSEQD